MDTKTRQAMAREADEADLHALEGELKCDQCGEWVPDFEISIASVDGKGLTQHICNICLVESTEFVNCEMCGELKHEDLMKDAITCKSCYDDMRIGLDERVS